MKNSLRLVAGSATALLAVACADMGTSATTTGSLAAFESVPAGFSSTSSSFAPDGDLGDAFMPHRGDGSFEDRGADSGRGPGGREGGPGGDHGGGPGGGRG